MADGNGGSTGDGGGGGSDATGSDGGGGGSDGTGSDAHYDVIVIGSGMGGLATASILAQVGRKRVLVLEAHSRLGGFLHAFTRRNYEWDPGVHYIGEMQDGSLTRQCMDLVTGGRVRFHRLDDRFERFVFPDETFRVPADPERYQRELCERFPDEAEQIARYFRDVGRMYAWSQRWFASKMFGRRAAALVAAGRKPALQTTRAYLDANFDDPTLKAVLAAQWPDYGTRPGASAFGIHGVIACDFGHGAYYPIGGSQQIADHAAAMVREHGGECLTRHPVAEILVEDGKACGVTVERRGRTLRFHAPRIVSNAGVATTLDLLPDDLGGPERERLARTEPGPSATILFVGLDADPRTAGFEDCNYWLYDQLDHDAEPDTSVYPPPVQGAYVSFGSLRNPGQEPHVAQVVTFADIGDWAGFEGTTWKRRGDEYEARKELWAEHLLDFVERRMPGFRSLVAYRELSTPLTVDSLTGHRLGEIYGAACTPARLDDAEFSIGTSVDHLYLTGTDVVMPGVNSALMIGVMTAGKLLGPLGMPRIMTRAWSVHRSVAAASAAA